MLLAVAERAVNDAWAHRAPETSTTGNWPAALPPMRSNVIGWYMSVELSHREFHVLEKSDYALWSKGGIILAEKGEDRGALIGQIWWVLPRCPECSAEGILKFDRVEEVPVWTVDCPGHVSVSEPSLWRLSMDWVAANTTDGWSRSFPFPLMEK
ncbi:MAG: hypothetical protein AAF514_16620 [Verrucomicrobiota bacterium]